MSVSRFVLTLSHLPHCLKSGLTDPTRQASLAFIVVLGWALVRFNHCVRSWIMKTLKTLLLTAAEILIVGWGLWVMGISFWNYLSDTVQRVNNKNIFTAEAIGSLIPIITSVLVGVLITNVGFWLSSRFSGSGAGKQNLQQHKYTPIDEKETKNLPESTATVNSIPTTPVDNVMYSLFPNEINSRFFRLEDLLKQVLSKFSEVPSIDLIAASFQDVNENILSEGGLVRSVMSVQPPLVAPITSSLPDGNPLLEEPTAIPNRTSRPDLSVQRTHCIQLGNSGLEQPHRMVTTQLKPSKDLLTAETLNEFVGLNKEDFFKRVSQLAREDRDSKRKPGVLSIEEQELGQRSLRDLDLKWMKEALRQVKPMHLQPIGTLTLEEATFSRNSIKEIIRQRRHENWVENMKQKGVKLFICPNCNSTTTEGHRCFATAWSTKIKKGPFIGAKEMLISQQGRGAIKLQEQMKLDQEHLGKSYQKLHEKKHLLTAQENQAQALRLKQSSNQSSHIDANLEDSDMQNQPFGVLSLLDSSNENRQAKSLEVPLSATVFNDSNCQCQCRCKNPISDTTESPFCEETKQLIGKK